MTERLRLTGITKSFGGLSVAADVNLPQHRHQRRLGAAVGHRCNSDENRNHASLILYDSTNSDLC